MPVADPPPFPGNRGSGPAAPGRRSAREGGRDRDERRGDRRDAKHVKPPSRSTFSSDTSNRPARIFAALRPKQAGTRGPHAPRRLSRPKPEAGGKRLPSTERLGDPLSHRRAVLEAVTGATTNEPDARMVGVRRGDEVGVGRQLVPARARRDERGARERWEAVAKVSAHLRLGRPLLGKLGIGVERRSLVVDRRLDAEGVDVRRSVSRPVVVTPGGDTRRAPGRAAVEEEELLTGDLERDELRKEAR